MSRARGERSVLAGVFETTEKTAPASGYVILPHMSNTLSRQEGLLEDDLVGQRDPGDADLDNPVVDGAVGVPVDVETFGFWLKALLGAPTTTDESGTYTHVFTSGAWSLPTMALEKGAPDVPSYEMFVGVGANRLQLDFQRNGRLNAKVDLIGQGALASTASTGAGTPGTLLAGETPMRFMQRDCSAQIDGSDVANVVSVGLSYSNNLDPVETITADGFIGGLDPMRAALSLTARMRFDSEAHFSAAKAGTSRSFSLTIAKSGGASLVLSIPRAKFNVPARPVDGPGGIEAEFNILAQRAADGGPMLTATLINEVATY